MDRHLCALLKAMSFKELYRSTAKPSNLLNTVAEQRRQTIHVLPPSLQSSTIPAHIVRRSRNTREMCGGLPDPLYNLHFSSQNHPTRSFPPPAPPRRASNATDTHPSGVSADSVTGSTSGNAAADSVVGAPNDTVATEASNS